MSKSVSAEIARLTRTQQQVNYVYWRNFGRKLASEGKGSAARTAFKAARDYADALNMKPGDMDPEVRDV